MFSLLIFSKLIPVPGITIGLRIETNAEIYDFNINMSYYPRLFLQQKLVVQSDITPDMPLQ